MIGRKLATSRNITLLHKNETFSDKLFLEEWKYSITKSIKKYSFVVLVVMVRLYVYTSDFLVRKYKQIKNKIVKLRNKKFDATETSKKEPNSFLKIISEYKYKIRKIKRQIKEEDENL
jgi:hypothetical protein